MVVIRLAGGISIESKEGRKLWQPGSTPRYAASGPRNGRAPSDKNESFDETLIAFASNSMKPRKACVKVTQAFLIGIDLAEEIRKRPGSASLYFPVAGRPAGLSGRRMHNGRSIEPGRPFPNRMF